MNNSSTLRSRESSCARHRPEAPRHLPHKQEKTISEGATGKREVETSPATAFKPLSMHFRANLSRRGIFQGFQQAPFGIPMVTYRLEPSDFAVSISAPKGRSSRRERLSR